MTAQRDPKNLPWTENYPVLATWLRENNAQCVAQLVLAGTVRRPIAFLEQWMIRGRLFIIEVRDGQRGWDVYTALESREVPATFADANERLRITPPPKSVAPIIEVSSIERARMFLDGLHSCVVLADCERPSELYQHAYFAEETASWWAVTTASMQALGDALSYRDADSRATYEKWAEYDKSAVELGPKRPRVRS